MIKNIFLFRKGEEREVPEKLHNRVKKAMDVLGLNKYERILVKPFIFVGFDVFEAGTTNSKFGCALGLPSSFNYESEKDIEKSEIMFRGKPINWDSETGKKLQKAIVLTEDEQIFAISKSILEFQTQKVLLNSLYPTASFMMVYTIGTSLSQQMKLLTKPFIVRGILYTIMGFFGLGLWSFLKDYSQVQYDKSIDEKLAELGEKFVKAGNSYYEKVLLKNMALRELIGDDTYTTKGNINYFIRNKSLPITHRKQFFNDKLNA